MIGLDTVGMHPYCLSRWLKTISDNGEDSKVFHLLDEMFH